MNKIKDILNRINIDITDDQVKQFEKYYEMLVEKNKVMNLTAITEKDEVIEKHFVDSIAVIPYLREMGILDNNKLSIIDLGTGAGFPGIPLKIMLPDIKFTLLDSLNKRVGFLNEVISELNLSDIITIHGRAEDYAQDKLYREKFDIVTSRAVANMSTLSEYCLPFVKESGYFIPYKSGVIDEEVSASKKALKILGGSVEKVEKFILPDTEFDRSLVFIKKIKNTPKNYPRKAGTPSKSPLS